MSNPVVSIGLPVFNGAVYLCQALDSLLTQTYENFELIIGDNASTDETESICRAYATRDSRIRYFRHSDNIGAVRNFLFVFEQAGGEFFMWAAHDDLWDRNWIQQLLATASTESGIMAYGQVRTIDDAGISMEHPANNRLFRFDEKKAWVRRLMYFLEYEGFGKANPIYGLYRLADVRRGFSALTARSPYADCLFLFDMLSSIRLKSVSRTFHYKRVHSASAGNILPDQKREPEGMHSALTKIRTLLRNLINTEATSGYIAHTVRTERFVMLVATPVKILFSCYGLFLAHLSARKGKQIKAMV